MLRVLFCCKRNPTFVNSSVSSFASMPLISFLRLLPLLLLMLSFASFCISGWASEFLWLDVNWNISPRISSVSAKDAHNCKWWMYTVRFFSRQKIHCYCYVSFVFFSFADGERFFLPSQPNAAKKCDEKQRNRQNDEEKKHIYAVFNPLSIINTLHNLLSSCTTSQCNKLFVAYSDGRVFFPVNSVCHHSPGCLYLLSTFTRKRKVENI